MKVITMHFRVYKRHKSKMYNDDDIKTEGREMEVHY